jgi:hypothetical protein
MNKRTNTYQLILTQTTAAKEGIDLHAPIQFEFENHDEIFGIIEQVKAKKLFDDGAKANEFAIGLKLFSEVIITNQDKEIFKSFMPAFGQFIKELKAYGN